MVKTVYLLLDDGDNRFLRPYDLTQVQFYALQKLAEEPKMLSQLSKELLCDPSNITRVADTLERKGLITRRRDENDRRVTLAELTAEGQELYAEVQQAHEDFTRQRLNILNPGEQARLQSLLGKLSEGLSQHLQDQTVS
jgi:DNA-binding MarR family transcriptional regulator